MPITHPARPTARPYTLTAHSLLLVLLSVMLVPSPAAAEQEPVVPQTVQLERSPLRAGDVLRYSRVVTETTTTTITTNGQPQPPVDGQVIYVDDETITIEAVDGDAIIGGRVAFGTLGIAGEPHPLSGKTFHIELPGPNIDLAAAAIRDEAGNKVADELRAWVVREARATGFGRPFDMLTGTLMGRAWTPGMRLVIEPELLARYFEGFEGFRGLDFAYTFRELTTEHGVELAVFDVEQTREIVQSFPLDDGEVHVRRLTVLTGTARVRVDLGYLHDMVLRGTLTNVQTNPQGEVRSTGSGEIRTSVSYEREKTAGAVDAK